MAAVSTLCRRRTFGGGGPAGLGGTAVAGDPVGPTVPEETGGGDADTGVSWGDTGPLYFNTPGPGRPPGIPAGP